MEIITTPMSVLRRQSLTRKLAYQKALEKEGSLHYMYLVSVFAAIALPFYAITT